MLAPSKYLPALSRLDIALRTKLPKKGPPIVSSVTLIDNKIRAYESVVDRIEISELEPHQIDALKRFKDVDGLLKYAVRSGGYFRIAVEIEEPNLKGRIV